MDRKHILAFLLYSASVVLFLIGFSIPYWTYNIVDSQTYFLGPTHNGLWVTCRSHTLSLTSVCTSTTSVPLPDWFKAVQVMEVLGLIAAIGGVVLCFLVTFVKPENRMFREISGYAAVVAAALIMIGVDIYSAKALEDLHAGVGLTTVSFVGLGLAGLVLIVINNSGDGETDGVSNRPGTNEVTIRPMVYTVMNPGPTYVIIQE